MASTSFIHGFHAITARLRLDAKSVHELYCDSARADPRMRDLVKLAESLKLRVLQVDARRLDGMAPPGRHQGVVARVDAVRLHVALDVWTAYQSLTTANQPIRTTIDLLNSPEQSELVALGRYKAGGGPILEVLNAQTALASARLQRVQATLDWPVYRATLAQAIGALDSGLLQAAAPGKQQP